MRILPLILMLILAACAKSPADNEAEGLTLNFIRWPDTYTAPTACTLSSTGTFSFLEWPDQSASKYSCNVVVGQTCEMLITSDTKHAQAICAGSSTRPTSCVRLGTGFHQWTDGSYESGVTAFDCGVWNYLRCSRFEGVSNTEMTCVDTELPLYENIPFVN